VIVGIGTDIVELARIKRVGVERLSNKILTAQERDRLPTSDKRMLEYVAGRFAAKEAIAKAIGTGLGTGFAFQDVEILSNEAGAPKVYWKGQEGKQIVHLSISHSEQYAVAMVVIELLERI
jgi:holo-[acyl-carrier protein] synthase